MLEALLQWDTLRKIIINTLLGSIPEELFLVMFTLILIGEFDYWKEPECKKLINRWDYARIIIPTVGAALASNIVRYTVADFDLSLPVTVLSLFILIIVTNDIFGDASAVKWAIKAFVILLAGSIIVGISELVYIPIILYGSGESINQINQNVFLNFLVSIPSRIILYLILAYMINRKRTAQKIKILKNMYSSPVLLIILQLVLISNFLFLFFAFRIIVYDKILTDLESFYQALIVILVVIFPVANIAGFILCISIMQSNAQKRMQRAAENLRLLIDKMEDYTNKSNHDDMNWKLNEFGMGIGEIAASLEANGSERKK